MEDESGIRTTKGSTVYPQVARTLAKLGRDISFARRRRHISSEDFAQQMGVSRATLHRLENGDPGISANTLTMAMFALGRLDAIADLADPAKDDIGQMMTRQDAPRRVQRARNLRAHVQEGPGEPTPDAEPDNGYVGW